MLEIEDAKDDFCRDYTAQEYQRDSANEDMRFVCVDGGQWEGFLEEEDRTKLEFDITTDYVDRYIGREELNDIGINYEADEGDASEEDADVLSGLYLNDYHNGDGEISTLTAKREAVICGAGAFRFATVPIDDEDPESALKVVHKPIYSAYSTVVWDGGAKRQDKADATRCHILSSFTRDGFERAYPGVSPVSFTPDDRAEFNWTTTDLVWVVERYHVEKKKLKVFLFANLITKQKQIIDEKDLPDIEDELDELGFEQIGPPKKIVRRIVLKSIFHGGGFLEEPKKIAGKFIPVCPIYGKYGFVDGNEVYEGMVRGLKDPQRIFNLNVSAMTDDARDTNRDIPIFDPSQVEGPLGRQFGEDLNTIPYLQVKAMRNEAGDIVANGPIGFLPGRQVDPNTSSVLQMTASFMDKKTGGFQGLDKDPDASGSAKREDRKDLDISTAIYSKSVRIAMRRAGDVYLSMAQEIYADQRRKKVMSPDGTTKFVNLNEHVIDEDTGRMVPVHDITKGSFNVIVKAGPQYESAREATVETLKEVLSNLAQGNVFEAPVMAALVANLPGVGIDELRELAKKQMLLMGMRQPESPEDEQVLAEAQEEQDGEQEKLVEAVALEQTTAAEENRSKTIVNLSTADLNKAKTRKTMAEVVDIDSGMKERRVKLLVDSTQPLRI